MVPHVLGMGTQIIPESGRFEPGEILDLIARRDGISFFAAPAMVRRLTLAADAADRFGICELRLRLIRLPPQYRAFPGVRGNGIASRTFASPVTYASVRSNPSPNPACGTVP
jgi:hypothetical protein